MKVQDFYPESGCALSGEQVRLSWFVQNAQKLFLYTGASKKEIDPAKSSELVTVSDTTEYTLEAVNGEKKDTRKISIQVLPLCLRQFWADYEEEKIKWDVCCGDHIKINGISTSFASGSANLSEYTPGRPVVLTAEGKIHLWKVLFTMEQRMREWMSYISRRPLHFIKAFKFWMCCGSFMN